MVRYREHTLDGWDALKRGHRMDPKVSRDFLLTKHAEHMLRERGIALEWIGRTLRHPQWTEPDKSARALRHALGAIAERGGLVLRVVYDPTSKPRRVITAFFDRRARSRS